eukprot:scaffold1353_cov161-Amphora_coffeaeformis.AAC.14
MTCEMGVMKLSTGRSNISLPDSPSLIPMARIRNKSRLVNKPTTRLDCGSVTMAPDNPPSIMVTTASPSRALWCKTGSTQR